MYAPLSDSMSYVIRSFGSDINFYCIAYHVFLSAIVGNVNMSLNVIVILAK
nr:MAG TPA: hypothetical protein [Crassvirales sp.]